MTDSPDGFKPAEVEPRFATAPEPDIVVPRAEAAEDVAPTPGVVSESQRTQKQWGPIRADVSLEKTTKVEVVDRAEAQQRIAEMLGVEASGVEISEDGKVSAGPISAKSDVKVTLKVEGPDGSTVERTFNPRAARASVFALLVGLVAMIAAFIILVAMLER